MLSKHSVTVYSSPLVRTFETLLIMSLRHGGPSPGFTLATALYPKGRVFSAKEQVYLVHPYCHIILYIQNV